MSNTPKLPEAIKYGIGSILANHNLEKNNGLRNALEDLFIQLLATREKEVKEEAAAIIEMFVDDDSCELDHHGYCQTHGPGAIPCQNQVAKDYLESLASKEGEK